MDFSDRRLFGRWTRDSASFSNVTQPVEAQSARGSQLGVNEPVETGLGNGTLYNSLLTFTSEGGLANHHRKLLPTYTQRLVWGQGDGGGLESVATSAGRIGGLICWEHWMPLARQALHNSGEHIHVAVWPTVHEMHQIASRHYAFEGRCFVLASGLVMRVKDLPAELRATSELAANPEAFLLRGGSAIIGPDGKYVVEPVYEQETIITAELDLDAVDREKMTLDVTGHYSRPDIFGLEVRRRESELMTSASTDLRATSSRRATRSHRSVSRGSPAASLARSIPECRVSLIAGMHRTGGRCPRERGTQRKDPVESRGNRSHRASATTRRAWRQQSSRDRRRA